MTTRSLTACTRRSLRHRPPPVPTSSTSFEIHTHSTSTREDLSFANILSGLTAFEISDLQEQETESRYPGDPDVTMLHRAVKLLNGVFADHSPPQCSVEGSLRLWNRGLFHGLHGSSRDSANPLWAWESLAGAQVSNFACFGSRVFPEIWVADFARPRCQKVRYGPGFFLENTRGSCSARHTKTWVAQ